MTSAQYSNFIQVTKSKDGRPVYSPLHRFIVKEMEKEKEAEEMNEYNGLVYDTKKKKGKKRELNKFKRSNSATLKI